ncbi:hypothetical protein [Kitasatospora sp. NPDC007106]
MSPVPPGEATAKAEPSGSRNSSASTPSTAAGARPGVSRRNRAVAAR